MIGKLANDPFVGEVKNGEAKALFAEVEFSHNEVRTVQVFPGMGEDSWPCKGDTVVVEKAGGFYYVSGVWDGAEPNRKPGEREIYSRKKDGSKAADILLDGEGNISLNGDGKRLVTYAELNDALQQMWANIKSHTHEVPGIMSGPSAAAATPSAGLAPLSLDISASETQTIKTGG
jgi:hypothetical protein